MVPPATSATAESLSIPLLVGVVGHRDLVPEEVPAARAAIERLLRALRDAQPAVPIKLLSAQAEGADLLVADVAHELGIDIIALLPFSAAQCRAELGSDEARAAFDRTMAGAKRLELTPDRGMDVGDLAIPRCLSPGKYRSTVLRLHTGQDTRSFKAPFSMQGWAAVSAMRRVVQEGHRSRPLQEKATRKSWPRSPQRARAKPQARIPHSR